MEPEIRMSFGERDLETIHRALDIAASEDAYADYEEELRADIKVQNKISKKLGYPLEEVPSESNNGKEK